MNFILHAFINSRHPKKVDMSIAKVLQVLGDNATIVNKEKYRYDKTQTEVIFKLPLDTDDSTSIIASAIDIISRFSSAWYIIAPNDIATYVEEFSGVCDSKIRISRIVWLSFMLDYN